MAAAADAGAAAELHQLKEQLSSLVECAVCREACRDPRLLPCIHTFCLACIGRVSRYSAPGGGVLCPLCRARFILPEGGVASLPKNPLVTKLVELSRQTPTICQESKSPTMKHVIPIESSDDRSIGITFINDELFVLRSWGVYDVYETSAFALHGNEEVPRLSNDRTWLRTMVSCEVNNCLYISTCKYIYRIDMFTDNVIHWQVDSTPSGLSVNAARNIVVTCYELNEIREYEPNGQLVRTINLQESQVSDPYHAVQLNDGQFIVSHCEPVHGVSLINEQGSVIASYRNGESTELLLDRPEQLTVTENGSVLVIDRGNNRLLVLDASLTNARELTLPIDGGLNSPECFHFVESLGHLYVGEESGRILIFDNIKLL